MWHIEKGVTLLMIALILAVMGVATVWAENTTTDSSADESAAPVKGMTVFKYSPSGYQIDQPEGLTSSISEFAGHTLVAFTTDTNKSVLSIDVMATNLTLDEVNADIKTQMETKKDFELISEEDTTLDGKEAKTAVFSYSPSEGVSKEVTQFVMVDNGNQYILRTEAIDGDTAEQEIGLGMVDSFKFIPIGDDNVSKMVKSKFKKSAKPSKGYDIYSYYSYEEVLDYSWWEGYHWDYVEEWCTCMVETIDYYCWCW